MQLDVLLGVERGRGSKGSRYAKISNNSSFGIIDIADSSTSDRIIVIVNTTCLIDFGAYR